MRLREACEHGRYELHSHHLLKALPEKCPGGREVTIDYEAAWETLAAGISGGWVAGLERQVVAAAIGGDDG